MPSGKRWTTRDRLGNPIYLTQERWEHIIAADNHPEMAAHEADLRRTLEAGIRKQDSLNPHKYRYSKAFADLPEDNTHVVVIVLFGLTEMETGQPQPNNYITTAYMREVG